ncbi:DUF4383 domain-containing protein [Kribbella sp. NPDC050124]|uniref:DUF4383 domain-containing protein n=1 Tax=Kribbella sp. NPDC050124 TaxID=3364114 RepID=UPI0037B57D69
MEDDPTRTPLPTAAQTVALWVAGALLTLACFGILPRLAQDFEGLDLGGSAAGGLLFGLFHVSPLHNVVHLLLGVAAVISAGTPRRCRLFLGVTGAVFIALVLYGQLDDTPVVPDLVPTNTADAWLHTLLALTMITAAVHGAVRQRSRG